jgi:tRNA pseudouridine55 synthase
MEGFLLIDKSVGMTSHDVVDRLRRITGIRTIGHAGTLDPFATGLLVMGVGRSATKRLAEMMASEKEYVATARLGASSDTQDLTGIVTPTPDARIPSREEIDAVLPRFTGAILQTPPMYSAKKRDGKKLYELAREGKEIAREPVPVTVHELATVSYEAPDLVFRARVSKGTYIRTLAHDIGAALGCGAYLTALRRTSSGIHRVEDAVRLEDLTPANWQENLRSVPQP